MTNKEFEEIIKLKKQFSNGDISLPLISGYATYYVNAKDSLDKFILDVDRRSKYIEVSKHKVQSRDYSSKLPLVRIDINAPHHMNPDGTIIGRNHIHYFREEYQGDNLPFACEIDKFDMFDFKNYLDFSSLFLDFCDFFNINSNGVKLVV